MKRVYEQKIKAFVVDEYDVKEYCERDGIEEEDLAFEGHRCVKVYDAYITNGNEEDDEPGAYLGLLLDNGRYAFVGLHDDDYCDDYDDMIRTLKYGC